MVAPSNATAEISSQHSKMLTNTCHSFVDPCISAPAAGSNHSKRNYCQQITMRHAYVISTDSKFISLELQVVQQPPLSEEDKKEKTRNASLSKASYRMIGHSLDSIVPLNALTAEPSQLRYDCYHLVMTVTPATSSDLVDRCLAIGLNLGEIQLLVGISAVIAEIVDISDESESGSVGLLLLRRFVSYPFRRQRSSWKRIAETSPLFVAAIRVFSVAGASTSSFGLVGTTAFRFCSDVDRDRTSFVAAIRVFSAAGASTSSFGLVGTTAFRFSARIQLLGCARIQLLIEGSAVVVAAIRVFSAAGASTSSFGLVGSTTFRFSARIQLLGCVRIQLLIEGSAVVDRCLAIGLNLGEIQLLVGISAVIAEVADSSDESESGSIGLLLLGVSSHTLFDVGLQDERVTPVYLKAGGVRVTPVPHLPAGTVSCYGRSG
ncbi:protein ABERRANT POLLEN TRANSMISSION 1 [Dorcoceras hygrometricum]|uniref:Protein ABERRANT POLLEN TRANSMISSION 1 n=1 Tax=Dorcoceras hygrometricum TaxID=472368 RepID=A0A2Z7CLN4_9LAMI|nr:protein ABERRANT POLLEN TRANSMISSION 1 [Dorcoceras hygrometricum]